MGRFPSCSMATASRSTAIRSSSVAYCVSRHTALNSLAFGARSRTRTVRSTRGDASMFRRRSTTAITVSTSPASRSRYARVTPNGTRRSTPALSSGSNAAARLISTTSFAESLRDIAPMESVCTASAMPACSAIRHPCVRMPVVSRSGTTGHASHPSPTSGCVEGANSPTDTVPIFPNGANRSTDAGAAPAGKVALAGFGTLSSITGGRITCAAPPSLGM